MTQLRMSLLGSGPSSFEPTRSAPISSAGFYPARPVLKRARTPYLPSAEHKRRRTSPTGAFSRLSLSPTSHPPSSTPSTLSPSGPIRPAPPVATETKMRSVYSAYDLGPDRVFIESLSDGPSSPSGSEDERHNPFELDKKLAAQLDAHHHSLALSSSNALAPAIKPSLETQLVLYRRPTWPINPSSPFEDCPIPDHHSSLEIEEPQSVEIDQNICGEVIEMDDPDSCVVVPDSMEID